MDVRVIPTKVHGALDYVSAPALIAAPDALGLNGGRASALAPRLAGVGAALYSPLTDYELGVRRVLPMKAHLLLDGVAGAVVAATPWLSGSARSGMKHWLPHAVVGATEMGLALLTKTEPPQSRGRAAWTALRRSLDDLSPVGRGAAVAVPIAALGVLAYVGRKRLWQVAALAAEAVEEVADAVEDAADFVEDAAEDLGDAARAKASPEDAQ